jgi:ribulose-phosphate 3-epimerase
MSRHISPSLLAADFGNLEREIKTINESRASWLHCDIMDGVFVPNISFGIPVVKMASRVSLKPLDVHLMIVQPEKYIDIFCRAGIDILTIHVEACRDIREVIPKIRSYGVKAGVTLRPHTPVESLREIISEIDLILVMSVEPGFGGQEFIEDTYSKIAELRKLMKRVNSGALVQVDGGINLDNAGKLFDCGVDILVTGTTVFKSDNPVGIIDKLLDS